MTWAERIDHVRGQLDYEQVHAPLPQLLARVVAEGSITQLSRWIAQYLFVHGAAKTAEWFAPVRALGEPAAAAYLAGCPRDAPLTMSLVLVASAVNALAILDYAIPDRVLAGFRDELARVELEREFPKVQWNKGLAAIAIDHPLVWVPVAGHLNAADVPWQPGATFGANVQGLIGHLGAARSRGAALADVEPAWHSFMDAADVLVDERQIDYATILWIARVVLHDIGGLAVGEVGAGLEAEIRRCVAAGR